MTTIAVDEKWLLAADGMTTCNGLEIVKLDAVKAKTVCGRVYAVCGPAAMLDTLINWHRLDAANPNCLPKGEGWTLVVCDAKHGVMVYSDSCPYPSSHDLPFACGSGDHIAVGAMMAGADARRAVEIAAQKNVFTGGAITVIDIAAVFADADMIQFRVVDGGA